MSLKLNNTDVKHTLAAHQIEVKDFCFVLYLQKIGLYNFPHGWTFTITVKPKRRFYHLTRQANIGSCTHYTTIESPVTQQHQWWRRRQNHNICQACSGVSIKSIKKNISMLLPMLETFVPTKRNNNEYWEQISAFQLKFCGAECVKFVHGEFDRFAVPIICNSGHVSGRYEERTFKNVTSI